MPEADAALLARVAGGERAAFDELVRRHGARVRAYLVRMTRDPAAADDALQETLLRVWSAAGSFRGDGSARGWILAIARRSQAMLARRRVGEPREAEPLEALGLAAGFGQPLGPDVESRLTDRLAIERALDQLSPEDREVLWLRDAEGFAGDEVAEILELSLAAVKSRLHRARLRLLSELVKGGFDGPRA